MKEIDFLPEWYKNGRRRRMRYRTQYAVLGCIFVVMHIRRDAGLELFDRSFRFAGESGTCSGESQAGGGKKCIRGIHKG
jgi:hypothetical protein